MANGYVDLKARRGQITSFRIDHLQEIMDIAGGEKSQIMMLSRPQPIEISHTRAEALKLIEDALKGDTV